MLQKTHHFYEFGPFVLGRRMGSRESIHRLPRPSVPRAPSLWVNPMPPRTTEESYRLPVSDRTMVDTFCHRHACRFREPKGTVAPLQ